MMWLASPLVIITNIQRTADGLSQAALLDVNYCCHTYGGLLFWSSYLAGLCGPLLFSSARRLPRPPPSPSSAPPPGAATTISTTKSPLTK